MKIYMKSETKLISAALSVMRKKENVGKNGKKINEDLQIRRA